MVLLRVRRRSESCADEQALLEGCSFHPCPDGERKGNVVYLSASMTSTHFTVSSSGLDYGVIFLPRSISTAHFALQVFPEDTESADLVIAGYPADKDEFTLWASKFHSFAYVNGPRVISGGVSYFGQSGSPLFQVEEGRFVAKGILTNKTGCNEDGTCPRLQVTYFLPFTESVLREIRMWIAMSN